MEKNDGSRIFGIRHSAAKYGPIRKTLKGSSPESGLADADHSEYDLTEEGVRLAQESARVLLNTLDPAKDELFFVTSEQRRAIDTANVYRDEAVARGFHILEPAHPDRKLDSKITEGSIRVLQNLSLRVPNILTNAIFMPGSGIPEINWEAVPAESREKWLKARSIIEADDRGSWGANFLAHSKELKKHFPDEIRSVEDLYETEFKNLMRLARFALDKAEGTSVKVLAFGHENYFLYALKKHFGDSEIGNCETVELHQNETGQMVVRWKGKEVIWT